jgi:hypothetical protein
LFGIGLFQNQSESTPIWLSFLELQLGLIGIAVKSTVSCEVAPVDRVDRDRAVEGLKIGECVRVDIISLYYLLLTMSPCTISLAVFYSHLYGFSFRSIHNLIPVVFAFH